MAKQMQNSIRNSIVSTTIKISKDIEVGRLIGRKGRNLKPIAEKTGTHIHVIENTNPIEIKIEIIKDRVGNSSPWERIDEAKFQLNKLLEDIETKSQRKDMEKEEKNVRISDNGNHQHATPRNHKDNDSKEKRKRFNRKMSHTTKTRQSQNKEYVKRNA
ncbi:hypothetical protein RhiirA5_471914 [Rhizophagus irregularis]|uniref:K Homology domain-containing protein n=1 Tax=Rhizophagus irregularis TaxID=588596 RepID=A0A2N0PTI0_9GLOM|nr:hypothetical protein RhiirA5_471914 [Rhizophagus irregularis]CAB5215333.1 unnamed protein product [Rhizophagus irregularis]